ncbi:ribosomal-processing cysteine protease Prp [Microaerobacter geothermalis]|uniref:ribosomal-processing cysteine protease Prp n=1 Tax=Microaerobacter geothermalis TaxID=674972 RepID=UPI001F2E4810|nr:ribosomal-processing cysteine protease Prp [Microaerobacter geothermalis]MCF6092717.1 ribosomal-processing cysteine protease Prp [Microaerobacter geothermalis]
MITVKVDRLPSLEIESVTVSGHAQFADPGKDIVCSAVSGITLGMINAVEMLLGISLDVKAENTGYLYFCPPRIDDEKTWEKMQWILEAMVAALVSVSRDYGSYVKVKDPKY